MTRKSFLIIITVLFFKAQWSRPHLAGIGSGTSDVRTARESGGSPTLYLRRKLYPPCWRPPAGRAAVWGGRGPSPRAPSPASPPRPRGSAASCTQTDREVKNIPWSASAHHFSRSGSGFQTQPKNEPQIQKVFCNKCVFSGSSKNKRKYSLLFLWLRGGTIYFRFFITAVAQLNS